MNKEEREAIKDSKELIKELNKHKDKDFIGRLYYKNRPVEETLQILLKVISKQKKEIKETKSDLKYVLEKVLGAFKNNWCIDWNFTDIREKYKFKE